MNDRFARQRDLVEDKIFDNKITIVGVGGIGSFLTLTLAKMGFEDITVYDHDKVEEYNLPNQFYRIKDVTHYKTFALSDVVGSFTDVVIGVHVARWLATEKTSGVLISCVDNMDTREAMFHYAIENPKLVPWFVDGRMGRHQAEVYVIDTMNKRDISLYTSRLWKQSQVDPIRCTEKAIIYNVLFIASMICAQLKLALEGKIYKPALVADLENSTFAFLKEGRCV